MAPTMPPFAPRLVAWMKVHGVSLWGAADLRDFTTPEDDGGSGFPAAISFALPMAPRIMSAIQKGPNHAYAAEYARVNQRINTLVHELADAICAWGFRGQPLAASQRTDSVNIKGDFPHKTAATRAGIGWIGRHCQLITRPFGSWVRLGTVFTDMELPCGPPLQRHHCGRCTRCVRACPARALSGEAWQPGIPRAGLLDVYACDRWKKTHYRHFHNGHNCGICSAVCPYGLKYFKRERESGR